MLSTVTVCHDFPRNIAPFRLVFRFCGALIERMWQIQDGQGQIMALAFRQNPRILLRFPIFVRKRPGAIGATTNIPCSVHARLPLYRGRFVCSLLTSGCLIAMPECFEEEHNPSALRFLINFPFEAHPGNPLPGWFTQSPQADCKVDFFP